MRANTGWSRSSKGQQSHAKRKLRSGHKLRAASESLETRTLLSLAAPVSYNIGTAADGFVPNAAPASVATGDFNGDGKLDMVVSHTADNSVYFLRGNGDGTFQPAVQIAVGEGTQGDVFAGDFNHDGKLDLFLPSSNNTAVVLIGNGDGTFKPRIDSSSFVVSGYYARGWTVGDFNGDGNLDVASGEVSNTVNDGGSWTVLLGNGDGTFKPGIVGPAGILHYTRWIIPGDFNHDGKLDLAVADGQGTSGNTATVEMTVLLGNGDGTFTFDGHYPSPQFPDGTNTTAVSNPEDVNVGDVNGDGKLDVIESDYDNTINVFIGNGDGTFQPAKSYDPGNYPRHVAIADVNHDGKMDLVVTNVGINVGGALLAADGAEPGSVAVLYGNGDGTFQDPITYGPSAYPGFGAVADFNGDGYPDVAVTQVLDGHSVKVMLNQPTSTNLPPTFVDSPSASPVTVTGKTTALSVLGADDGGEANLTYTWSTVGPIPAPVTYSINGSNAAKNTTATFTKAGTYLFQCLATDAQGLPYIDLVAVGVNQTLTSVTVTPSTITLAAGAIQQFTAIAYDQFGAALTTQPTFIWSSTGVGSVSTTGLYTAPSFAGTATVTAAATSVVKGNAAVTVQASTSQTTIFGTTAPPAGQQNVNDPQIPASGGVEIGLKFRTDVAGTVTGLRFYKSSLDTGTHTGELWTIGGTLLATATFSNETASGWQQVTLSSPVTLAASTTYIVSYHTNAAYIAYTPYGLASSGVDNPPLHVLANGVDGSDGVYKYGASSFPTVYNGQAPLYWVDVVFTTSQTPLTIFGTTAPPSNFQNVNDPTISSSGGVELGLKFRSDVAGFVDGVRFFKGSLDTGTQTGELWSSTGQLLATATFGSTTGSGWQSVNFSSPVAISANTTYIVSYHTTSSYIAYTPQALASAGIDNSPLHILANGVDGYDGVYKYGSSAFPTVFNGQSPNYWVDVLFTPG